jgi:hypothetical protein
MSRNKNMNHNEMKIKIANMMTWSLSEALTAHKNEFNATMNVIADEFKNRLAINNKEFVYVMDISDKLVSRRLVPYCTYMNGYYIGRVYLDTHGNIFGSIQEVNDRYGDNAVYATSGNNYYNCTYYSECVYLPNLVLF